MIQYLFFCGIDASYSHFLQSMQILLIYFEIYYMGRFKSFIIISIENISEFDIGHGGIWYIHKYIFLIFDMKFIFSSYKLIGISYSSQWDLFLYLSLRLINLDKRNPGVFMGPVWIWVFFICNQGIISSLTSKNSSSNLIILQRHVLFLILLSFPQIFFW